MCLKTEDILKKNKDRYNEAALLLAHSTKKTKEYLFAHPEYRLSIVEYIKFRLALCKLKSGYSVASIIKHKEFYGLDFYVDKNVLIPRPETEMIVDEVINAIKEKTSALLIDVGTGSGCIPISIIKTSKRKDIKTVAIDISEKALKVAKNNTTKHGVNIDFLHGNLLAPLLAAPYSLLPTHHSSIIITANLPYLTQEQFDTEPSIQKEPKLALISDNKNGLDLYKKLIEQISQLLSTHHSLLLLLEIDPSQNEEIIKIINEIIPSARVEVQKDFAGRDRLVKVEISI